MRVEKEKEGNVKNYIFYIHLYQPCKLAVLIECVFSILRFLDSNLTTYESGTWIFKMYCILLISMTIPVC